MSGHTRPAAALILAAIEDLEGDDPGSLPDTRAALGSLVERQVRDGRAIEAGLVRAGRAERALRETDKTLRTLVVYVETMRLWEPGTIEHGNARAHAYALAESVALAGSGGETA